MRAVSFLLAAIAMTTAAVASPADVRPASLVGIYDGGQTEIAAGIKLSKDGTFQYGLSYGALDEVAVGKWAVAADTVVLTVQTYESNDPSSDGKFGPSVLKIEKGVLILPRHDRVLRFTKQR